MKLIVKDKVPKEWKDFSRTPGAVYQPMKCLREALYKEQGGICGYCMQRLKNEWGEKVGDSDISNRIEHIKCRDNYPELQLDYQNMILCCNGKTANSTIHCDRKKENTAISFSPLDIELIESISYKKDGTIHSFNNSWQTEMDQILNLNTKRLKMNREATLRGAINRLKSKKWKTSEVKRELINWNFMDASGLYKPYCGVVTWYLNKKLNAVRK